MASSDPPVTVFFKTLKVHKNRSTDKISKPPLKRRHKIYGRTPEKKNYECNLAKKAMIKTRDLNSRVPP